MNQFLPFLNWLKTYKSSNLSGDLSAGLTVGVMLIPQGMAYSMLAGLPPIFGLYAATIPLIIYAIFGTSRQLAAGPVAMVAFLISSGVGAIATLGSSQFIAYAILLAFMVGSIQFLMGVFRLGFLVNFLAQPVISGFISAAAIIIGFSQLKHLLGINIPRGEFYENVMALFQNINQINFASLAIGITAILILLALKKLNRKIPGQLVVVILGMLAVYFFGLNNLGVKIVKEIPSGFPNFAAPIFETNQIIKLLPIALTISFLSFMQSMAMAKTFQEKHKDYEVDANQELIALGLANIGGSFFQSFPVSGGFSRTAVNDQAGSKTGLASIISASLIIVTLLFLTPYFYYLPTAVLAAIILVAVVGLIDFKTAKNLWQTDKKDCLLFVITALATLFLGIEEGVLVGVLSSLFLLIHHASFPHIAELGWVENTHQYRNVNRFNDVIEYDNMLIVRLDAQLFFANSDYFIQQLAKMESKKSNLEVIILDAASINKIDSTAVHTLKKLLDNYQKRNIKLYFAGVIGPVRDTLKKTGFLAILGENSMFMCINDAVKYFRGIEYTIDKKYVIQTNL